MLPTELARMRAFVRTFCQELPVRVLDEEGLSQLELAVTEAASNIMRHAYHGRTDQRIQVIADAFADRIVVRLWHRGTAFDPEPRSSHQCLMAHGTVALACISLRTVSMRCAMSATTKGKTAFVW